MDRYEKLKTLKYLRADTSLRELAELLKEILSPEEINALIRDLLSRRIKKNEL